MDERLYEIWWFPTYEHACAPARLYATCTLNLVGVQQLCDVYNHSLKANDRIDCYYEVREIIPELDALAILGEKNG